MEQFIHLMGEMSPFLLLGFFLAGLMHAFIPGRFYTRYLSADSFSSVIYAALFGIPLPLCSCGVIPTAMSLRKEGASKGAVVSFLIATPQTGVDSIIATYGLMGLPFAIIRPIAALVTAVFGGALATKGSASTVHHHEHGDCHCEDSCHCEDGCDCHSHERHHGSGLRAKIMEALEYGFVHMMEDIGKWLVVGLAAAALITIGIPTEWFAAFQGNTMASMLLVLCIAIPMYVCATGSIPIAVALMLKGLTPGAALVLLMAGPACNIASMLVVRKVLGTRTLLTYLLSIVAGAIAFGTLVDYLQFNGAVNFIENLHVGDSCCAESTSWFSWGCTALLGLLLFNALVITKLRKKDGSETAHAASVATYHIEGMNCNHCRQSAEDAILAVQGVTKVRVDLQEKKAYVEGDATSESVCEAIASVGFTGHPHSRQ